MTHKDEVDEAGAEAVAPSSGHESFDCRIWLTSSEATAARCSSSSPQQCRVESGGSSTARQRQSHLEQGDEP